MRLHVALAVAFPTIALMLKADHPPRQGPKGPDDRDLGRVAGPRRIR
jgi:hypothetical protein